MSAVKCTKLLATSIRLKLSPNPGTSSYCTTCRHLSSLSEAPLSQQPDLCQVPEPDGQSADVHQTPETASFNSPPKVPSQTVASLAARRRSYNAAVSKLRKQYASERAAKLKAASQAQQDLDRQFAEERVTRLEVKKEMSRVRQLAAGQKQAELMEEKAVQRQVNVEYLQFRLQKVARREERSQKALQAESVDWIEEKNLERRVLDALAYPNIL